MMSVISVGVVCGFLGGFAWIHILLKIEPHKRNYISTLGALFLLYGAVEFLGGEGIIAAFVFSMLLGNYPMLHKKFLVEGHIIYDPTVNILKPIKVVQEDISFLVKVFFFVLIGAIFDFGRLTPHLLLLFTAIISTILISRYVSVRFMCRLDRKLRPYSFTLTTMIPRGFVATVLAFLPFKDGIIIPYVTDLVFLLVIVSNVVAITSNVYYLKYLAPNSSDSGKRG